MREISFEVDGLPPIKNEALSLFNAGHGHAPAVRALLAAARDALRGADWDPGTTEPLALSVVLRPGDQRRIGDAPNYLGGIADVLEDKGHRQALDHLGELAAVHLYRNDEQLQEIHLTRDEGTVGYRVILRPVDRG